RLTSLLPVDVTCKLIVPAVQVPLLLEDVLDGLALARADLELLPVAGGAGGLQAARGAGRPSKAAAKNAARSVRNLGRRRAGSAACCPPRQALASRAFV